MTVLITALAASLVLNGTLWWKSRPVPETDLASVVQVITTSGEFLVRDQPLSLGDVERRFCVRLVEPEVVILSGLNTPECRRRGRPNGKDVFHWVKPLPETLDRPLYPGDVVHVISDPTDFDSELETYKYYEYREGEIAPRTGAITSWYPSDPEQFWIGSLLCEMRHRYPSDSSTKNCTV